MLSLIFLLIMGKVFVSEGFHRGRDDDFIRPGWRWKWLGWGCLWCFIGAFKVMVDRPGALGEDLVQGAMLALFLNMTFVGFACGIAWIVGRLGRASYASKNSPPPLPPHLP